MTYEKASYQIEGLLKTADTFLASDLNVDCATIRVTKEDLESLEVAKKLLDDNCRWILGLEG